MLHAVERWLGFRVDLKKVFLVFLTVASAVTVLLVYTNYSSEAEQERRFLEEAPIVTTETINVTESGFQPRYVKIQAGGRLHVFNKLSTPATIKFSDSAIGYVTIEPNNFQSFLFHQPQTVELTTAGRPYGKVFVE